VQSEVLEGLQIIRGALGPGTSCSRARSPAIRTRHGTFDDVIAKLPYVRDMGFDVLYFPPIHPIGRINRKGRNNTLTPAPTIPAAPTPSAPRRAGTTRSIPSSALRGLPPAGRGGHEHGLEIALDFAIQCAPDHPWIKEHPEWFDWRPDGTIKYAENPPKKYEDIVNVHFYREPCPRCGTRCATSCCSGSSRA
jgi:starch synthase (maltosyl-transferring)